METIALRLKKYIDFKGISLRQFEMNIGVSNGSISSQLKENKNFGSDRLEKILNAYTDLNPNWLLTGNGEMIVKNTYNTNEFQEPAEKYELKKQEVPLYDVLIMAGTKDTSYHNEAKEYIHPGDLFLDADSIMRVYGDSMEPKYNSGCFVPVKSVNKDFLIYGQDYIIETSDYRVLKRLQKSKSKDCVLACSINQEVWEHGELAGQLMHEPIEINISEIKSIYLVLGVITRNQISNIYGK